ncbi:MAG: M28 family peptidase [Gemmatimonadales bacterium]
MHFLRVSLTLLATPLSAQGPGPLAPAAKSITGADVMRRVSITADDSMMGRDTPSRGLELTAAYVASEFRRAGLRAGGDSGSYLQRFGINRWIVDSSRSVVEFDAHGTTGVARVGVDARFIDGPIPNQPIVGPAVLIAGTGTPGDIKGRIVLLVPDLTQPVSAALSRQVQDIAAAGPKAVLLLSNREPSQFADRVRISGLPRVTCESSSGMPAPVLEVHERGLSRVLAASGIDLQHLRQQPGGEKRSIDGLTITVSLARKVVARARVPNVIGILEGADPALRNEYLVYSAHIDHIGITPGQADSINNGADDNASGVAGLLGLLEAFTRPGIHPRRSLIFFAPSGEEPGLLGSEHFTEHPPVPLQSIVADINMDLIGRNWRDSVIAVGLEQSDLGETLRRVVQSHPELRMTPIADRWPEERIFYRSDHYNFARRGVPILFFTSGTHADYHRPTDDPGRIDGEKESRLLQLLFYLGAAIADQGPRPRWNPESYRQLVDHN